MTPRDVKINQIRMGMKNLNVEGIVMNAPVAREVFTKRGPAKVADVLIADDTGEIQLSLWDDDINKVKVGDRVELENAYVNTFKGTNKLSTGMFGKLVVLNV